MRPSALLVVLTAGVLLTVAPGQAQTCSQLRSCAEAMEALRQGNRALDRDGDGVPCQNTLCKGYRRPTAPGSSVNRGSVSPVVTPVTLAPRPAASRSAPARAAAGPVVLVSVGDGDTIRVRGRNGETVTVRLACIDAPETAQGSAGADATAALAQLLTAGALELRPQTVDRYGRTVAEVIAGGRNVNLELVRSGAAFVYRKYLRDCDAGAYEAAEQQAQRFRQGVWRWDQGVERPWDFRNRRRQ